MIRADPAAELEPERPPSRPAWLSHDHLVQAYLAIERGGGRGAELARTRLAMLGAHPRGDTVTDHDSGR